LHPTRRFPHSDPATHIVWKIKRLDDFADDVRDLPWNKPEEDLARRIAHFRTWDMQILPSTR
jgi:hypothetical protein